jgi:hypothetical protein
VVLNAVPPRSGIGREAAEGLERQGTQVAPAMLSQRAAFAHSVIDGRTAQELEPGGKAAEEVDRLYLWLCSVVDMPHAHKPERPHDAMTKRPSLFGTAPAPAPADPAVEPESNPAVRRPPSREGKRVLSIYLKPGAWKQLRMLSVSLERPSQSLGEEALNLLFEKHRLNRIA